MSQEQAFLEAFDMYADALYRHAYFRISDKERAKDLVSDTFMKTWDYIRKGNDVLDMRPFLYRTLNRVIIDEYRKKKPESLDALLDDQEVPISAFDELVEGSLEKLEWELDAKRVPELLEAMPHSYREVVVMRYIDGLMPAEIAEMLDESVNSVSVRIHRGLQWLTKYVEGKK
jgi:RNA polymerase sigma-70 factor (ECF subfamily)